MTSQDMLLHHQSIYSKKHPINLTLVVYVCLFYILKFIICYIKHNMSDLSDNSCQIIVLINKNEFNNILKLYLQLRNYKGEIEYGNENVGIFCFLRLVQWSLLMFDKLALPHIFSFPIME